MNSLFGVIVPQIAFTYVVIYWLVPKYFYKKIHPAVSVSITVGLLAIFYVIAVIFKYSPVLYNILINDGPRFPVIDATTLRIVMVDQLTSLPIITGIAFMIKLIKRWWLKQRENEQLAKEKTKAELQLLKAQIHPHFLFNTLNNIYFFTLTNSAQAPEMIKKLSDMLHYVLRDCNQPLVPLEKEIKMIRDYLELEKIRYREQLDMSVELPMDCKNKMIAPLLLIPFIENSFKHGASKVLSQPYIKLRINLIDDIIHVFISNSKPVNEPSSAKGNIGLKNVKKRLQFLYPEDHELTIQAEPETFSVSLKIKLQSSTVSAENKDEHITTNAYAIA